MFDVYMRDEDLDAVEVAIQRTRKAQEHRKNARFEQGKEAYEAGEPVETLENATQKAGWHFAKGQSENSGTFQYRRSYDELEADLADLRNGTIQPLVSFEDDDGYDDTGYSESVQPYLW